MISRSVLRLRQSQGAFAAMAMTRRMNVAEQGSLNLMKPRLCTSDMQISRSVAPIFCRNFVTQSGKHVDEDPEQLKQKLLQASLFQAKYRGFNDEAIVAGCRDLDLPAVTNTILKNGPFDIVTFAQDEWLKQMRVDVERYHHKELNSETGEETDVVFTDLDERQKIKVGVEKRLQVMSLYIDKWPQGMALGLRPENLSTTLSQLYKISDEIWYLAGDRSTSFEWYNKRHQLLKVYIAAELYMLQDKSQGFAQTQQFLDRRLDEMYGLLDMMDKQSVQGVLASLQIGASAITSIFSQDNLQMDDSLMDQYQEMLKKMEEDALGDDGYQNEETNEEEKTEDSKES